MEASNNNSNNGTVTVEFGVTVLRPDGLVSRFQKDVLLSASVYQRGLTDISYRVKVTDRLLRQHQVDIMALRSSWHCNYCEGGFEHFNVFGSGLNSEVNGKIPSRVILIPVCSQKECYLRAKQTMHTLLGDAAQASGMPQLQPSRTHVQCDNCRRPEETAGSFQKCSRCKVAFYCGRSCQVADWPAHKRACRSVSRSSSTS